MNIGSLGIIVGRPALIISRSMMRSPPQHRYHYPPPPPPAAFSFLNLTLRRTEWTILSRRFPGIWHYQNRATAAYGKLACF